MVVVITSGYFDPVHIGHLEYFHKAKRLGDIHICIVNTNKQAMMKKDYYFMDEEDRVEIVGALKDVDMAMLSIDTDATVCKTLEELRKRFPNEYLIFAKGGDRNKDNIPEYEVCRKNGIIIMDGLGGKVRSSSEFIAKAKEEPK